MSIKSIVKKGEPRDPTPQQLVESAMRLFAQHGIEGVSLRTITAAAGAANQSAVHYHFHNKQGLVRAVIDLVNEYLAPLQRDALAELEEIAKTRPPTVREIVGIGLSPYVYLSQQSREGQLALRFLARMTWESGEEGQDLLLEKVRPYFLRMMPYLQAVLPHKPVEAIDFHLYMAASNLIHGLADLTLLGREPKSDVDHLYRERPQDLLRYFYDYMSAGLASDGADVVTD